MNTNQVRCSKPHYNRWYSFEVCIHWLGIWHLLTGWHFVGRPIGNVVCYIQKVDAVSKNSAGWLPAVFLTAFSPYFHFCPWFSFGVAESLTPWTRKEKTQQKDHQLHVLNKHNWSLISLETAEPSCSNVGWCYPIHWINHYPVDNSTIGFPILIHWIMISLVDSAIKQQGPVSVI